MDIISRAMKRKQHLCDNIEIEKQKWAVFNECIKGKQLFLFGVGEGMNYFLRNYGHQVEIAGVIDNDIGIQGQNLGECCDEAWQTEFSALQIWAPEMLMEYPKQEIVVLVTSINFYFTMMEQMKEMGIEHSYVLLLMEADKRENLIEGEREDIDQIRENYIEQCCDLEIEEKKIVMLIGVYGSHARQITKALLKEREELDIVWIVSDMHVEKPDGIRLVYMRNWKRYIYEMETAKIWVFDDVVPVQIRKREAQIYIQVKHWSSLTLKKFFLDDKSSVFTSDVEAAIKYDGARMDYLFTGSDFDEESCRSGFMFQGKAIRVGSPRSDILFDRGTRDKVIKHFGLKKNARICLYVPTYRKEEYERNRSMSIILNMELLLRVLKNKWDGEWYLLIRLHPSLVLGDNTLPDSQYVINAGRYSDSEELVAASDIMITDYSSIMFEAAYKKEPVFLYAPDRRNYVGGERDLLMDYNRLPFPVAESNEELKQNIIDFEAGKYQNNVEKFLGEYGVHEDGHASERAAGYILKLLERNSVC